MRAQTELPAIGIAFVLLTAVLVFGISTAHTALSAAERPAVEQQAAVGVSERLTAESASVTTRSNVLDPDALGALSSWDLHADFGVSSDHQIRVNLDGQTVVESGQFSGGTTIDRLVVIEQRNERTLVPSFEASRTVILPRRTPRAMIDLDPPPETTVRTLRANDRVLLRNESGLRGEFEVTLSQFETTQLSFETAGLLSEGDVSIEYYPAETRKATLSVTVDV